MEDNNIINQKELNDMNDAPSLESNKILYNCTQCQSEIEIKKIDEDNIEFNCNNNHNIKMKLKDYLATMKEYNNIKLNSNTCNMHKEEYISYCFECNKHLCKECLKKREHSYHYKINIIEIIPSNDILIKIRNLIKKNKTKIETLNKIKTKTINKFNYILNKNINKIKNIKIKNIEKMI